jgi:hypothetical protein
MEAPSLSRPKQRMDWRFLRKVHKLNPATPEAKTRVYEYLIQALRELGFSRVCVTLFNTQLLFDQSLGDSDILHPPSLFCWKIRRVHQGNRTSIIHIPIVYGYAPPVMLSVLYDPSRNRKAFPSLLSIIRMLYYYIRCSGLQMTLNTKEEFLSVYVQSLLKIPEGL